MTRFAVSLTSLVLIAMAVSPAMAQSTDSASLIRGTVHSKDGTPIAGADVFLIESLEGSTTDSAGHFTIRTTQRGIVTFIARRIGFTPTQRAVDLTKSGTIDISLVRQSPLLAPITVTAGSYTAGDERGAFLYARQGVSSRGAR